MIGSGIFLAPSLMAKNLSAPGIYLGIWALAGLLTLLGAFSYAELAAMMPEAGGQYVYLRRAMGRLPGFLYGWTLFLVIQSGFVAAVAIAFAKYLGVFFPSIGEGKLLFQLSVTPAGPQGLSTAQGVALLPRSAKTGLDAVEADPVLMAALGPTIGPEWLRVKRSELATYDTVVSPWERAAYLRG